MGSDDNTNRPNILIIEDDAILSESISDVLTFDGNTVFCIDSAESIVEMSFINKFDIILLDLNLPGEDGISFANRIRTQNDNIGLIIHSARTKSIEIGQGYASGADIYIKKPASMQEICNAVRSLYKRINKKQNANLNKLKYNPKNNLLSMEDLSVELTETQSTLLISFTRAKENTLETWQIADLLGLDLDCLDKRKVELQISRLRQKIELVAPRKKSILAIRGYGYQLVVDVKIIV
jgi:DNA-binding response OmpR family regulator